VDPVGPSPLIIHKSQLAELLDPFWNLCLELKRDQQANAAFGWVLEMWAWALAAARAGVRHQVGTHAVKSGVKRGVNSGVKRV
jgi:hypothetical protein